MDVKAKDSFAREFASWVSFQLIILLPLHCSPGGGDFVTDASHNILSLAVTRTVQEETLRLYPLIGRQRHIVTVEGTRRWKVRFCNNAHSLQCYKETSHSANYELYNRTALNMNLFTSSSLSSDKKYVSTSSWSLLLLLLLRRQTEAHTEGNKSTAHEYKWSSLSHYLDDKFPLPFLLCHYRRRAFRYTSRRIYHPIWL